MPVWMMIVEWLARAILILMLGLSVWSISIMIDRKRNFKLWLAELSDITQPKGLGQDLIKIIAQEKKPVVIERLHDNFIGELKPRLEKGLPTLGTLGGIAPFIGLLGTVLAIIKAFGDLSMNSQNTNKVMFLLAEALILTAVGLAVAIPAVVAFNVFTRRVKAVVSRLNQIKNNQLNSLET